MAISTIKVVAAVVIGIAISIWGVYGAYQERIGGGASNSESWSQSGGSSRAPLPAVALTNVHTPRSASGTEESGRERTEQQSIPIPLNQKPGAREGGAASTPDDTSECAFRLPNGTVYAPPDIPSDLPREFNYSGVLDSQLEDRAEAGDGYAQQVLGMRMQSRLIGRLGTIHFSEGVQRQRWEAEFDAMRDTFIAAIRNRSLFSASLLGETLLMPTPKRDPIEAAAWLKIEQTMGGDTLQKFENRGWLELTPDETRSSEVLAELFVQMYKLQNIRPDWIDAKALLSKQFPNCEQ